ncbi:cytochrome c peroxidase [Tamlana sp. 2_MG-2023]|uniref:cytochrome-c peroxidase n=1 Tax=unclassified Tamlana TaxID=2614803 RepID=UPI0026E34FA5|nr:MULTISPECIES: cytochrome c peroxidase [unclassified Tamlana]MDO6761680.1 cytochrome c peroxidase [Tamlana sp. 2_MG-2023]MDO6792234.1 cytochrome c peroxidase [Tamlana sp. 1_MG-2023]
MFKSIGFLRIFMVTGGVILLGILLSFNSQKDELLQSDDFVRNELLKTYKVFSEMEAISEMYLSGTVTIEDLKKAVSKSRLQYKRIEFYLAYHYPEYIKKHINGAPLLRLEFENSTSILEPEGLQVLDELVYSEEVLKNVPLIYDLNKRLKSKYLTLFDRLYNDPIKKKNSIDVMRLQLVRLYTLGLTGFDTPGSLNAIEETKASLEAMQSYFKSLYLPQQSVDNYITCITLFSSSIKFLNGKNDFENFDRLQFLKDYMDPLYKELKYFQAENLDKNLEQISGWNRSSESIFDVNFLNPYSYTELTKSEDSEALKNLGEKLFYDAGISGQNNMSCASCHQPDKAFTDGLPKSLSSIQGKTVLRNSPTLLNAVYADRYFYDLRAYSLEQQAEHVIFNPSEFNTGYSSILEKLKTEDNGYQKDFENIFGKKGITRQNLSKALASYIVSLSAFNSEFDKYIRGETENISERVKQGFNLFMGKANCATCHFAPTFSGLVPPFYNENESEILGVLIEENVPEKGVDTDRGRVLNGIYKEEAWIYEKSFKTTTVRNTMYTAPFFHNGAYTSLEEVVEFYNQGGGAGLGLEVVNQTLPSAPLLLTDQEKENLVLFMKALSDNPAALK